MKHIIFLLVSMIFVAAGTVLAQDQDRIKKQDRIHQEDHLMMKDGSCLLVKAGNQTKLQEPYKLNNGTIIHPDGSYQLQNQEKYRLRDGECMDMNGGRYLNQNKFNKRVMMTHKQMERVQTNAANKNQATKKATKRAGKTE